MGNKKVLIIGDNIRLFEGFQDILKRKNLPNVAFDYRYSPFNDEFAERFGSEEVTPMKVSESIDGILDTYSCVIALHCKQIFPPELVKGIRCINIHPGLNPHNRGWFPHVFSIINGLPVGVTLHEMDEELDHGPIIDQEKLEVRADDTSTTLYERLVEAELRLLDKHLEEVIEGTYETRIPRGEGNINYKRDYKRICELDLEEKGKFGEFLNKLRALSHEGYRNAYFIDPESGKKIHVSVKLERE